MATLNRNSSGFKPFIMTIDTTLTGVTSTGPTQFKIPLTNVLTSEGLVPNYRFRVKWGDGTSDKIQSFDDSNITHTYSSGGTYSIKIYGTLDRLYFNYDIDSIKIINVEQWGSVIWKDFSKSFAGCENFTGTTSTDVPRLDKVRDFSEIFSDAYNFNYNLSGWNVSNITSMKFSFYNTQIFNQPLSNWDVSNVVDMSSMFFNSNSFNQNIGNWNIENVQFMDLMLTNTIMDTTNYDSLLTGWTGWIGGVPTKNVKSGVTFDIDSVPFSIGTDAEVARNYLITVKNWTINDGNILPGTFVSIWYLSSPTTISLPLVSGGTYNFTVTWGDGTSDTITAYNQTEVTHTYSTSGTKTIYISGTIEGWSFNNGGDNTKITSVSQWGDLKLGNDGGYFYGCSNLNLPYVSDVLNLVGTTNLTNMFNGCTSLTAVNNINSWDVSNVTDISSMFSFTLFNQPINNWDVSNVTGMTSTFNRAYQFNQPLSGWNVSNVTDMSFMFQNTLFFNQPIGNWNVSGVTNMSHMFSFANSFNQSLSGWNTINVTDMSSMFQNATSFDQSLESLNVTNVVNMSYMLDNCPFNYPLSGWNVSYVTNMVGFMNSKVEFEYDYQYYDNLLNSWSQLPLRTGVQLDMGGVKYSVSGLTSRQYIINTYNWTINDGGIIAEPNTFISNWYIPLATTITLPLHSTGTYDFMVNWGDGNIDHITAYTQSEVTHSYSIGGSKTILIDGIINGWRFNNTGDKSKITSVSQWGDLRLGNSTGYFYGCDNLTLTGVTDTLNLSGTTNLFNMFRSCTSLTTINNIENWDVSNVTDMAGMFTASLFNQPLSGWNVSNVIDTTYMFASSPFDQPIGNWDVGNVNDMSYMFAYSLFNQDLSSWNVISVSSMNSMLRNAIYFNQPIGNWDVSSVIDMDYMLDNTNLSNTNYDDLLTGWTGWIGGVPTKSVQSNVPFSVGTTQYTLATDAQSARDYLINTKSWTITDGGGVLPPTVFASTWDTTLGDGLPVITLPLESSGTYNFTVYWGDGTTDTITSYSSTTKTHNYLSTGIETIYINGDLNGWRFNGSAYAEKITSIEQWGNLLLGNNGNYFDSCANLDLSGVVDVLNLSGVTNMSFMFVGCLSLTTVNNINSWDVSNVTNMGGMFQNSDFDQPLSGWNVSYVTNMSSMFESTDNFNQPLSGWNVSNVTDMSFMFYQSVSFNQNIDNWNVSNVTNMNAMFYNTTFDQPIGNWNVSGVTNMGGMFANATNFNQPLSGWNVSNVTDMSNMFNNATNFNQPLSGWNVSNVTNMNAMFYNTTFDQPIGNWNVSNVTNMSYMFYISSFNQPIGNWDVSNVTNMANMFQNATNFNQPLSGWNVSGVTNMGGMFANATNFNQPLSGWNVSNVTDMSNMFNNATNFNQPLSGWNVSNVTNMNAMFYNTTFDQPIGNWNVSNVTNMNAMFYNTTFDQPIGNWNVSNVTNMSYMFYNTPFNQPIGNWNVSGVTNMYGMFNGGSLDTPNYDNILTGWTGWNLGLPTKSVQPNVLFDAGGTPYSLLNTDVVQSRNYLTGVKLWTIVDGGGI